MKKEKERKKERVKKRNSENENIGHRPLWGRCPASPSTRVTIHLGRARVPLIIKRFCDY